MADPFIGEIKMFGGTFAPRSYADCDGQLLPINQNQSLFSLLGTQYGGDGRSTFGLPDLRGRVPIHKGQGPQLTNRTIGSSGGAEQVVLNVQQIPSHTHGIQFSSDPGDLSDPTDEYLGVSNVRLHRPAAPDTALAAAAIGNVGGSQGHENMMPFQVIRFIIAVTGLFPSSN